MSSQSVIQPDPIGALLHSRKFLLAVADAAGSTAFVLLTRFLSPSDVNLVLTLAASWQPVIIAVIWGITKEDTANIAAGN